MIMTERELIHYQADDENTDDYDKGELLHYQADQLKRQSRASHRRAGRLFQCFGQT